jgi:hypothetical protein
VSRKKPVEVFIRRLAVERRDQCGDDDKANDGKHRACEDRPENEGPKQPGQAI